MCWIILAMCRLLLLLLLLLLQSLRLCHGGDGMNASHVSDLIVAEGAALFVHNVPLGQAADALEDVLPVDEAELHVAHASPMRGAEDLVRVEVDDAGLLGVGPAQAEGEGVGGARMIADDDRMLSDGHRGKCDGLTTRTFRFATCALGVAVAAACPDDLNVFRKPSEG